MPPTNKPISVSASHMQPVSLCGPMLFSELGEVSARSTTKRAGKYPGAARKSTTALVEEIVHACPQSKTASVKMAICMQGASLRSPTASDGCRFQQNSDRDGDPGQLLPELACKIGVPAAEPVGHDYDMFLMTKDLSNSPRHQAEPSIQAASWFKRNVFGLL